MAVKKKGTLSKKSVSSQKKGSPKKAGSNRLKRRSSAKKPLVLNELKKNLLGILVLVSICLTFAMIADIFFKPGRPVPELTPETIPQSTRKKSLAKEPAVVKKIPRSEKKQTSEKESVHATNKPIEYEVFKDIAPVIIDTPKPGIKDKTLKIAIIIDDIGYDRKMAMALFELNENITFSVLPFSPFGQKISKKLHAKGAQLMLHLPMEPVEYPHVNPGPGAILSDMNPDQLLSQLKKDIQDIPNIVGVNNHMGSKLTASADQMNQIFTILKKENLFFIDSKTAPQSKGKASARLLKVQFAQRDVFLDNFQDSAYISGQFEQLIDIARRHGSAIGIGHPYKATLETLSLELPKLEQKIKIVRASELTHIPG